MPHLNFVLKTRLYAAKYDVISYITFFYQPEPDSQWIVNGKWQLKRNQNQRNMKKQEKTEMIMQILNVIYV